MAQLAPTTLNYGQLVVLIQEFLNEYNTGSMSDINIITENIQNILTQYNALDGPMLDFEEFVLGEPAESAKLNRIWSRLQNDVNLVSDQLEVLRAAVIFSYNYSSMEIELAKNQNAQASNKLKALQLYSSSNDSNIVQFGDQFVNFDLVDLTMVPQEQQPFLIAPGMVVLGRENNVITLTQDSVVKILDGSNGFSGNNQEILDPFRPESIIPAVDDDPIYSFKAEIGGNHADVNALKDEQPITWFEYENYYVNQEDRDKAKGFNFKYIKQNNDPNLIEENSTFIDWANGPDDGILTLNLEFDLKAIKTINSIVITPFGLEGNVNSPINVKTIQTSEDGTNWSVVPPENVYIASVANLDVAKVAPNVSIGLATFSFTERSVRYVHITLEQIQGISCNIGHLYYETPSTVTYTYETKLVDGEETINLVPVTHGGDRIEGPIPPENEPLRYYLNSGLLHDGVVQKLEYFEGKRWAIGVRDIVVREIGYRETSMVVSKPLRVTGIVDRVSLEANCFIPSNFPNDTSNLWIKFYVSPDDGLSWYPISRIQDDYLGIPEIIAFNDPIPAEFREVGVQYITTNSVVNTLRLKVELARPSDLVSTSPILNSYTLKVVKR